MFSEVLNISMYCNTSSTICAIDMNDVSSIYLSDKIFDLSKKKKKKMSLTFCGKIPLIHNEEGT